MLNVAVLTVHSCPLATLGEQDAGGMNVYVLALAHSIIGKDLSIDIYTREHESCTHQITNINKSLRIIHLPAGQRDLDKYELLSSLPDFIENLVSFATNQSRHFLPRSELLDDSRRACQSGRQQSHQVGG